MYIMNPDHHFVPRTAWLPRENWKVANSDDKVDMKSFLDRFTVILSKESSYVLMSMRALNTGEIICTPTSSLNQKTHSLLHH